MILGFLPDRARPRVMPLGFSIFIPEGCLIIAQRFNVGYRVLGCLSPEGTAEIAPIPSAVPFGTNPLRNAPPNVETLGYCRMSLRD